MQADGALVLAYLSVGTVERWRHYAAGVPRSWTLGAVDGWPGERFVDARKAGWRVLMAREAQTLAAASYDGLYLDVAELHPRTATGVVKLVEGLSDAAPDLLLVAQNGLAVADRLPDRRSCSEDVFWRWDGTGAPPPPTGPSSCRGSGPFATGGCRYSRSTTRSPALRWPRGAARLRSPRGSAPP